MSRGRTPRVVGRRALRAAGALSVVALTALGPSGPGFFMVAYAHAVGTVRNVAEVPAAADVAGPLLVPPPLIGATGGPAGSTDLTTGNGTITAPPSAPNGAGIPGTVLAAYRAAESALAASDPACHLPWTLIAGIGRVESGHASGGRVDAAGTTRGHILGPRLDGAAGGTAVINDTDGGALDGDTAFDRAVGPMQFIPGTWRGYAKDGNNDGVASPDNVFDAALAAGSYLCAGGGDLSQPAAQRAALLRYNRSDVYGALVLRWAAAYAGGVAVLPGLSGDVPPTSPTPPAQVPAPAVGNLDAATSAALAAPAPAVTGPVASESSAGGAAAVVTTPTSVTAARAAALTSTTTPTATAPTATTTTRPATTEPTTTEPTTTAPTTTELTTTKPTTTKPTTSPTSTTSPTTPAPVRTRTTTTTSRTTSSTTADGEGPEAPTTSRSSSASAVDVTTSRSQDD